MPLTCPNCRKPELRPYLGYISGAYECQNCAYLGPMALMKNQKKKANNKKKTAKGKK